MANLTFHSRERGKGGRGMEIHREGRKERRGNKMAASAELPRREPK